MLMLKYYFFFNCTLFSEYSFRFFLLSALHYHKEALHLFWGDNDMTRDYLTEAKPMKAIFLFALPIIIGNMFQQFYTMADSAIVGRYVSSDALGAIGASTSLTNVFIWIAIGAGIGCAVIVGNFFGAKNFEKVRTASSTSLISTLILSLALAAIGFFASRQIMTWLDTPGDCLDMAAEYLRIYFLGLPFLFMYNILSNLFNALGKSRIPLYFLIFSSLFNIGLDFVAVVHFDMGIAGAAWATMIAQGISAIASFIVYCRELRTLTRDSEPVSPSQKPEKRFFDKNILGRMLRVGLPSILQQSTISIGMLLIQGVVNSFGGAVLAGFSAAGRIESLGVIAMASLSTAISSYTAQNLGANKQERVESGVKASLVIITIFAVIEMLVFEIFTNQIVGLFISSEKDAVAFAEGVKFVKIEGWFYIFIGFKMAYDGVLRGASDMPMFTVANLANLGVRLLIAKTCAVPFGVEAIAYATPIGWLVNLIISYLEYRTGKWRTTFEKKKKH